MKPNREREKTKTEPSRNAIEQKSVYACYVRGREGGEVRLECNSVWSKRGPRANGEEEMDGGGILIISHSQGEGRAGTEAPIGVMVNSITQPPYQIPERIGKDFCPQTQTIGDS